MDYRTIRHVLVVGCHRSRLHLRQSLHPDRAVDAIESRRGGKQAANGVVVLRGVGIFPRYGFQGHSLLRM